MQRKKHQSVESFLLWGFGKTYSCRWLRSFFSSLNHYPFFWKISCQSEYLIKLKRFQHMSAEVIDKRKYQYVFFSQWLTKLITYIFHATKTLHRHRPWAPTSVLFSFLSLIGIWANSIIMGLKWPITCIYLCWMINQNKHRE